MKGPGASEAFNRTKLYHPAPYIFCAFADAFREKNKRCIGEYLKDANPLSIESFGELVSLQCHTGASNRRNPKTHRDYFWRLLMVSVTLNFKRRLITSKKDVAWTFETGDVYIACPTFQHAPVFFDSTTECSVAFHISFGVKVEDFMTLSDERVKTIESMLEGRWKSLIKEVKLPSDAEIEAAAKNLIPSNPTPSSSPPPPPPPP